jgi:hypothetical protein
MQPEVEVKGRSDSVHLTASVLRLIIESYLTPHVSRFLR